MGRLNTSPIRPYIEKMYISGEMGIRKPEAGFFQIVYDDLGMTPERWKRTVIVGDGLGSDILAGATPTWTPSGTTRRKGKSDRYYPHLGGGGLPGGPEDHPGGSVGENWTRIQAFFAGRFQKK